MMHGNDTLSGNPVPETSRNASERMESSEKRSSVGAVLPDSAFWLGNFKERREKKKRGEERIRKETSCADRRGEERCAVRGFLFFYFLLIFYFDH